MAGAQQLQRGPFITFEGGDGTGKSTHIARLAEHLRAVGHEVVVTREPGGSPGAEAIRELLVSGAAERWSALAEALLVFAARADHLEKVINPARARGAVVLCDRFADSTMAYQGVAGGLGEEKVRALRDLVVGEDGPDLTIVLDAPAASGLERAQARGGENRFEAKGEDYQAQVREAFLRIAAGEPRRCVIVDSSDPIDDVAERIRTIVEERFSLG